MAEVVKSSSCDGCGKTPQQEESNSKMHLKQCGACRSVSYCSTDCQKNHWPTHKNACTKTAALALFHAIQTNDTSTIQRMSTTKRIVNAKIDYTPPDRDREFGKWTALHECVRVSNPQAIQILVDGGCANLSIKDVDGESPLFVASSSSSPACLQVLVKAGANPNAVAKDGFSALMMAIRDGSYDHVKLLLEGGASPYEGCDMFGRSALSLAQFFASGQGGMRAMEGESFEEAQARNQKVYELVLQYS